MIAKTKVIIFFQIEKSEGKKGGYLDKIYQLFIYNISIFFSEQKNRLLFLRIIEYIYHRIFIHIFIILFDKPTKYL